MPAMHEVDYKIFGDDMQFVEVELDPGEAAVAEAGGMFYMEDGISMETVFGDGSAEQRSFVDALIGAGKRLLIGESPDSRLFRRKNPAASRQVTPGGGHRPPLQNPSRKENKQKEIRAMRKNFRGRAIYLVTSSVISVGAQNESKSREENR